MIQPLEGLLLGRTLADRYTIEAVIGRGGMSVVYRAMDGRLRRPVALKLVSVPDGAEDRSQFRARLKREAGSAARIPPHPNVVQVYDYGTDPELDLDFIVMELLEGRDLKAALATGPVEPDEGLRILREAARGLAAGHRAGIVHRDVKPANIFLTGRDRLELVKILDFGIAKALEADAEDDLTRTGARPHSPAYASPEQLDPGRPVDAASDVYQLGLVAYEMIAGERPYTDAERDRIRAGERIEPPSRGRWAAAPEALRTVVSRALEPDPTDRPADGAAFAEALAGMVLDTGSTPPASAREDDATVLVEGEAPAPAAPAPAPAAAEPRPGAPAPPHRRRQPAPVRRAAQIAATAVLVVLGVWAIPRLGGGEPDAGVDVEALDVSELHEEFRPLLAAAAANLWESESVVRGEEAAEEIRRVIVDLNQSWVRGELDRHAAHYADRVDFYNASGAPRSRIRRERGEALERYPEREITIERTAVEFPEPGRARALVDKSWRFGGADQEWTGSARQELTLELEQGRWVVTGERDVEVYASDRR